jgi:hypothetical protein
MGSRADPREKEGLQDAAAFVGRARATEALLAGLEDAASGRRRLFVLAGVPGIGKSDWRMRPPRRQGRAASGCSGGGAGRRLGRPRTGHGCRCSGRCSATVRLTHAPCPARHGGSHVAQILPDVHELFSGLPPPPSVNPDAARFCRFDAADTPSLLLLQFLAGELSEGRRRHPSDPFESVTRTLST